MMDPAMANLDIRPNPNQTGCKGVNIISLKKIFSQNPKAVEEQFIRLLDKTEIAIYQNAMAINWIPAIHIGALLQKAASVLYPKDQQGLWQLGRALANDSLNSIYKFMMRLTTVQFVISQGAKLWKLYQNRGECKVTYAEKRHQAVISVTGCPDLPETLIEALRGFIHGTSEMTGVFGIKVITNSINPDKLEWIVTWP